MRGSPKLAASTEQLAMKIKRRGRREQGGQPRCYYRHPQVSTMMSTRFPARIVSRSMTGTPMTPLNVFQGKSMAIELSEEEMRKALFGASVDPVVPKPAAPVINTLLTAADPTPASRPKKTTGYHASKLRVTLHVSKVYEGDVDVFVHDSSSLSKLIAEQEAKAAAKKQKYKYLELVSIESTSK
ncbi:hypothetical protein [Pseudomonas silesiensis]|uniref:hypothetical protein n=1 Tax=Pseudomonas silesiensis TaxID=1853130 RepID=UPI0034D52B88